MTFEKGRNDRYHFVGRDLRIFRRTRRKLGLEILLDIHDRRDRPKTYRSLSELFAGVLRIGGRALALHDVGGRQAAGIEHRAAVRVTLGVSLRRH